MYTEEARSVEQLKQKIIAAFDIVKQDRVTLNKLKDNIQKRARLCFEQSGRQFEQLLQYR